MADNLTTQTTVSTVPDGTVIATEEISGAHYQKIAIVLTDGTTVNALLDVGQSTMAGSLPVTLASDQGDINISLDGESVSISGTVAVQSNSANLATETTAAAIQTAVEIIDNAISGSEMQVDVVGGGPIGATTDVEATTDGSVIAILKRLRTLLSGTIAVSASSLPLPTGAATAANQSTANTALSAIQTAVEILDNTVSGSEMQTDVVSVPAPLSTTGGGTEATALRVTIANDSTGLVSVDDGNGSITVDSSDLSTIAGGYNSTGVIVSGTVSVDDGGGVLTVDGTVDLGATDNAVLDSIASATAATQTAVEIIDNAISGSEMQVDVVGALPAGTNLIGDVVVNDIEDGTGDSVMDTTNNAIRANIVAGSASGTEYTEDAAAPANPAAPAVSLVRADTPATITSTDGDIVAQRGTNYGAGFVQVLDSSGNFIDTFGGSGGTSHADDAAFTIGSASSLTPTGYLADETTPDSVDEGDVGVPRMTLSRKPYAVITDATSENNAAVDGSGHLQVDIAADSVGIGGGTQYTEDDPAAANPVGTMGMAVRADSLGAVTSTDGDVIALRSTNNGELYVKQTDAVPVTDNGGSLTVDGTVDLGATDNAVLDSIATATAATQTAVEIIDNAISGTEMQVDVVGALPAGTNNIGDVDIASSVALDVSAATVTVDLGANNDVIVSGTDAENAAATGNPVLVAGRYDSTPRTLGNGDAGAIAIDADGAVHISDGGNTITVDGTITETNSAAILADTGSMDTNLTTVAGAVSGSEMQVDVVAALPAGTNNIGDVDVLTVPAPLSTTGGGTEATALRVTIANDSTGLVSVDDGGSTISIDDGGGVITVDGTVDLGATDNAVLDSIATATAATQTAVETIDNAISGTEMQVDVVGALPAGTNTVGAVNVKPATSGGLSIFRSIDLDETEEAVKASAGQVFGWYLYNSSSAVSYVKFYNATTGAVTVGTTTPVMTIPVPGSSGANVEFTNGIAFSTAITAAATTGVADADTGAPAANDIVANILYA